MITETLINNEGPIGIEEFYSITYACFNKTICGEAKANRAYIEKFIKGSEHFNSNSLICKLYELVFNLDYPQITDSQIELALGSLDFQKAEIDEILKKIQKSRNFTDEEERSFRERLKVACAQGYANSLYKYRDMPVIYNQKMKEFDYKSNMDEELPVHTLKDNIADDVDAELDKGVLSTFDFINDAFARGKYYMKQIVGVCAPPGTGKSMFLQQEAITFARQGRKVHLMILGDQTLEMVMVRLVALAGNFPMREVTKNFKFYRDQIDPDILDNLYFTVKDSYEVMIATYIDFCINGVIKDVDILMIDYDANFVQENEGMYQQGLLVYNSLTKLKNLGKLVFIATQPKQSFFNAPDMDMTAPGESSGKIHVLDMLITIGIDRDRKMRMGFMKIAKMRNGEGESVGKPIPWVGTKSGRLAQITPTMYEAYVRRDCYLALDYNDVVNERAMELAMQTIDDIEPEQNEDAVPGISQKMEDAPKKDIQDNGDPLIEL